MNYNSPFELKYFKHINILIKITSRKNNIIVESSTKNSLKSQLCLNFSFFLISMRMSNLSLNQIKRNEIEIEDNVIKDIRNRFKSRGKDNPIKDKVLRDTRTLFQSDEDYYYEPIRTGNSFSKSYIEYKVMVIRTNLCLLKSILTRLEHI